MAYVTQVDLQNVGIPPQAFGQLEQAQINAALQNASDFADNFFRARYGMGAVPFLAWDTSITEAVAAIAAFRLIAKVRGVNPASTDYQNLRDGYKDAVDYLNKVQRQQAHPNVTLAAVGLPGSTQPNLISSSVIDVSTGMTGPNRGW